MVRQETQDQGAARYKPVLGTQTQANHDEARESHRGLQLPKLSLDMCTSTPKLSTQVSSLTGATNSSVDFERTSDNISHHSGMLLSPRSELSLPDHYDTRSYSSGKDLYTKQPPSSRMSFSDLSSTAAEVAGINQQSRALKYGQHTQDDIPGLLANERHHTFSSSSEHHFTNGDSNKCYTPREHTRRSASVAPMGSEYVLIDQELHQLPSFNLKFRSFTPPGSVPLQREKTLRSPLSGTEKPNMTFFQKQQQEILPTQASLHVSESTDHQVTSAFTSKLPSETISTTLMPTPIKPENSSSLPSKSQMVETASPPGTVFPVNTERDTHGLNIKDPNLPISQSQLVSQAGQEKVQVTPDIMDSQQESVFIKSKCYTRKVVAVHHRKHPSALPCLHQVS